MDDDTKIELGLQEQREWDWFCGGPMEELKCVNCRNLQQCQPDKDYAKTCDAFKKDTTS